MPHHRSPLKPLFFVFLLLTLLTLGIWTVSAQDGDLLPLPGQTSEAGTVITTNPFTFGGLLNSSPGAINGQSAERSVTRAFTFNQHLTPPAISGAKGFGIDLGRDGNLMVVGAPLPGTIIGNAFIYEQSSGGTWESPVTLSPSDGAPGDQFGHNVAMVGETVFVGAPAHDTEKGAVYVFTRDSGGSWVQTQKLQPILADGDRWGAMIKVDPSGTQILVGTETEGVGAYIYRLESGTWQYEAHLAVTGISVGTHIDGNRALVSDWTNTDAGSVRVFEKSAGAWTEVDHFSASDSHVDDRFGGRIGEMNGQYFITGDLNNAGAVYVFEETSSGWTQQQKLTASDGALNDGFGISVAPEGDTLAIGSALDDTMGSVYLFKWNGSAWTQDDKIAPVGGAFGIDVLLNGSEMLIGAAVFAPDGRVYRYLDSDIVPTETPTPTATATATTPPTTGTPPAEEDSGLLVNGGFEADVAGWTLKDITSDKVKCNKIGKVYAHEGNCAWRFKGAVGENAKIEQTITAGVDAGDTLTLSGFVNASSTVNGQLKVTVKYLDASQPKGKITVNIGSETGGSYAALSTFQPLLTTSVTDEIEKIKVSIKNQGESGKVYYDALSLTAS